MPHKINEFVQFVKNHNKKIVEINSTTWEGRVLNAYVELVEFKKKLKEISKNDTNQKPIVDIDSPITAQDIANQIIQNGWVPDTYATATRVGNTLKIMDFERKIEKYKNKTVRSIYIKNEELETLKRNFVVGYEPVKIPALIQGRN